MSKACSALHRLLLELPRFHADFADQHIPTDGLYVMFQKGEVGHDAERIVRVGTHTGHGQLTNRLHQHFHRPNKDRSIFRKHVGRAILERAGDPFIEQWNWDLTSRRGKDRYAHRLDARRQQEIEDQITAFLVENISFVVLAIDSKEERRRVEQALLSTVASCGECHASIGWLGRHHPNEAIRQVGLWNIQNLNGTPLAAEEIRRIVDHYVPG